MRLDEQLRFWSYVLLGDADMCWTWFGGHGDKGYGKFWFKGKTVVAHRISYELTHGHSVPRALSVDHLCHTQDCVLGRECTHRACVNPEHLKAVPIAENIKRGNGPAAN